MLLRFLHGQLTSARLLLCFCAKFLQKTIPLIQCQGWVFWASAGLLTSVSSNSSGLKFSFSPREKWASQKCQKCGVNRLWGSAGPLFGWLAPSSGLKKLAQHLQTFCWPEKFADLRQTGFRMPVCFSWQRNLVVKGCESVMVKIPVLTDQSNADPKPIIFWVWCDLWACSKKCFPAWISRSYKVNSSYLSILGQREKKKKTRHIKPYNNNNNKYAWFCFA